MKFPFDATPFRQFSLDDLATWTAAQRPLTIEMTDRQYSWFAHLARVNRKDYGGIPIVFVDAPAD